MKTVGIIAEFNPFHNGHEYIIKMAKEKANADRAIVIMSGEFTQQGNIAVIDKFKRAEIAINYGADLVIELPTIYAVSSAEIFAKGAVSILNALHVIDYLAFGTEADNLELLQSIVNKIIDSDELLSGKIKGNLQSGVSYAVARDKALKEILTDLEYTEISNPNNILAIEYLKSLKLLNSKITPIAITRVASNHNDDTLTKDNSFSSATSIRNHLESSNNIADLLNYMPILSYNALSNNRLLFNEDMHTLLRFIIATSDNAKLSNIYEISEGLENKIKNSIITSKSYFELLNCVKSKRYTMSRIKRIFTHILLDITNDLYTNIKDVKYARILKVNNKELLSDISKNADIPLITNISENVLNNLDSSVYSSLMLDFKADNIYNVISNSRLNKDRINKL